MEALILAGGKAERLGDAAAGRPKPLVSVAGRPSAADQVARLVEAGVTRVILSVAAGNEALFEDELSGLGAEIVAVGEGEPLGRGGGLRLTARQRQASGPVLALNGDELLGVDLLDLLERHRQRRSAATIVVSRVRSAFGVVELGADDVVAGFREAPLLPQWVNSGVYVLDDEAIARLPERGDHEDTTFPELAREGKLFAYRNESYWLTVNTPKQLREAEQFMRQHPELAPRAPEPA